MAHVLATESDVASPIGEAQILNTSAQSPPIPEAKSLAPIVFAGSGHKGYS